MIKIVKILVKILALRSQSFLPRIEIALIFVISR